MKKINKNKTVKTLQITGVEYVTPICEWNYLAEISCSHTKGKQKIYELYYLNKNNEIVAHFRHNVPFAAEQLHKDNERLFAVSITCEKYPHRIYRIKKRKGTTNNNGILRTSFRIYIPINCLSGV